MEGSKPLGNPRHEAFALLVAGGSKSAAAYREAVSKRGNSSISEGTKLARSPLVAPRIAFLRSKAQEKAAKMAEKRTDKQAVKLLDKREKREIAAGIARSPKERAQDRIAACRLDNDLAEEGAEAKGMTALGSLISRLRK